MSQISLIPVSELFSKAFELFSSRLKTFVALMGIRFFLQLFLLVCASLAASLLLAASGIDQAQMSGILSKLQSPEAMKDLPTIPNHLILPSFLGILIFLTLFLVLECWFYAALYYAAVDTSSAALEALKVSLSHLFAFSWMLGLVFLFILLGCFALILPGILFALWYLLAPYIYFAENKRGMDALRESKRLVSGYLLPLLTRFVALTVILLGLFLILWGLPRLLGFHIPFLVQLYSFFSIPFGILFQYLLYEDLRRVKSSEEQNV